ncbi:xylose isomerase [Xaviernesmea oryzae]|uniref:Xylose isomerase n=1 Tax=Xaviernesmea oryzae TaxID=464029 RepID=A0A1Q9AUW7_9HYPH|nr:TIM barrel protein [Xaviernesmea oryzae]OLP59204.1 xylose isomerase [Xaviernesmea oryzae]SEK81906.1 2-keto-myo-inositol isomerase [Xaviernesmea oryzae]
MTTLRFALNHMAAPGLPLDRFFALARDLGIDAVEIRNDLAGNAILDGTPPDVVKAAAQAAGLTIISINALQRFNQWTPEREAEAEALIAYARDAGAKALVLVPVNDGSGQADGERQANLATALAALKPRLDAAGLTGLVEPLGFEICSLRSKSEAADGIRAVQGEGTFKLVHDTFHHHLAGEDAFHPELTGLVHISGVADAGVAVSDMRDPHRVLVTEGDRLDNLGQIARLRAGGYAGFFSFEPFSPDVHSLPDVRSALAESIALIESHI